jgi:hypothetical protein
MSVFEAAKPQIGQPHAPYPPAQPFQGGPAPFGAAQAFGPFQQPSPYQPPLFQQHPFQQQPFQPPLFQQLPPYQQPLFQQQIPVQPQFQPSFMPQQPFQLQQQPFMQQPYMQQPFMQQPFMPQPPFAQYGFAAQPHFAVPGAYGTHPQVADVAARLAPLVISVVTEALRTDPQVMAGIQVSGQLPPHLYPVALMEITNRIAPVLHAMLGQQIQQPFGPQAAFPGR